LFWVLAPDQSARWQAAWSPSLDQNAETLLHIISRRSKISLDEVRPKDDPEGNDLF